MNPKQTSLLIILAACVMFFAAFGSKVLKKVDPGYVAVASFFGKVENKHYEEGLHFVNPLLTWYDYDVRQKTHMEQAKVPSQDQLLTDLEVSVQYTINAVMTPRIVQGTGTADQLRSVHLVPKLRSLLREQGKSIKRAEDFFLEETQATLQASLLLGLETYLEEYGVDVSAVLIRNIELPSFIQGAIEEKKEREQSVEKQKAELERYRTEQQQLLAQASAKREAAEQEALQIKVLADAKAYEIEAINKAIAENPAYIKLQALEALKEISKDPASKIYFLDGTSPSPLPLMHLGEADPIRK